MGACYENYSHEFISCYFQPTAEGTIFIQKAIKSLNTEVIDPWIEVFPVHNGVVYWSGWGSMASTSRDGYNLRGDYGVDELPKLRVSATGYLVRHVDQGRQATYEEIVKARERSLANYLHLVRWIEKRYEL